MKLNTFLVLFVALLIFGCNPFEKKDKKKDNHSPPQTAETGEQDPKGTKEEKKSKDGDQGDDKKAKKGDQGDNKKAKKGDSGGEKPKKDTYFYVENDQTCKEHPKGIYDELEEDVKGKFKEGACPEKNDKDKAKSFKCYNEDLTIYYYDKLSAEEKEKFKKACEETKDKNGNKGKWKEITEQESEDEEEAKNEIDPDKFCTVTFDKNNNPLKKDTKYFYEMNSSGDFRSPTKKYNIIYKKGSNFEVLPMDFDEVEDKGGSFSCEEWERIPIGEFFEEWQSGTNYYALATFKLYVIGDDSKELCTIEKGTKIKFSWGRGPNCTDESCTYMSDDFKPLCDNKTQGLAKGKYLFKIKPQ